MNIRSKTLLIGFFLVGTLTYMGAHPAYTQSEAVNGENHVKMAFKDVSQEDFIYPASQYLFEKGVFKGDPYGLFDGGREMNRAELVAVMVRMQKLEPKLQEYNNCFPDVKSDNTENNWFVPYVCYAKQQGWIQGYPDGLFRPAKATQKMEGLKIILNAFFAEEISKQTTQEIENGIYKSLMLLEAAKYDPIYYIGNNTESYSAYKKAWFAPYLGFGINKNLLASELIGRNVKFVEEEASRAYIAELIFRAMLMKEGYEGKSWEQYNDSLRDHLFLNDRKEFLSPQFPCYGYREALPPFANNYLKEKYSFETLMGANLDPGKEEGSQLFPKFRVGSFCFLENGGLMITGYSESKNSVYVSRHLLSFNEKGLIQKDESLECSASARLDSSRLTSSSNSDSSSVFLKELDPETFQLIDCRYSKDANRAYFRENALEGSYPETFKVLPSPYATDGQTVYVYEEPLVGADAGNFQILPAEQFSFFGAAGYAKDKKRVYFYDQVVEGADLDSFEALSIEPTLEDLTQLNSDTSGETLKDIKQHLYHHLSYAKDKNHVYLAGEIVEQFEVKSFELLNEMYHKDENNVYFYGQEIEGADLNTFEVLEKYYAKDSHSLYREGKRIDREELNLNTLEILNDYYFKDDKQVYYWNQIVKGADPMSAEIVPPKNPEDQYGSDWLRTKDAIYFQGEPFTACTDPTSFELINEYYAKDSEHVYSLIDFYPKIVEGANPDTFMNEMN